MFIGRPGSGVSADNTGGRERIGRVGAAVLSTALLGGCAGPVGPTAATSGLAATSTRQPAVERAAREELGPAAAEALPELTDGPLPPSDPGADALVAAILRSIDVTQRSGGGVTWMSLARIRNQSHATAAEFDAFRQRLAELLSRSGRAQRIRFVVGSDEPVEYELVGAAYLVTAQGFDQWELYLSLRPAGKAWALWRSDEAVRVLRQPIPGRRQILMPR